MSPRNSATTDSGKATSVAGSSTSSAVSPLVTIMIAMSPTTFDDGVTLTMSPNISLTCGIGARHFVPAGVVDAERARLLAQVGVLAAGHAVHVHLGRAGTHVALERRVAVAHLLPVVGEHAQVVGVEPGFARPVAQRFDDRTEVRLRREAAHRVERAVHGIAAGIDRREHAGGRDAAGVVRVEVHRQADLVLERLDQRVRRARLAQARHVLDAEDVRAGLLELLRHRDVVLEVVLGLARIAQVARVADGGFAQLAGLAAPRPSRRACCRPSSANRRRGTRRRRSAPPAARSSARRCRGSSCSRRRWPSAAASAAAGSASPRGTRSRRSHGHSAGSASRRRTSRRPSIRPRTGPAASRA